MKPTRINLNEALSWFDTEELRELKSDMTDALVERLKAIPKPRGKKSGVIIKDPITDREVDSRNWVEQSLYELQLRTVLDHYSRLGKRIDAKLYTVDFPDVGEHTVTQMHIDTARDYPIEQLLDTPIKNGMTNCPFHIDQNPSFSVKKYNRYKCFSCGESGDAIDLYMKLHNVGFLTAVKAMAY